MAEATDEVTIGSREELSEAFSELADINTALNRKQETKGKAVRRAKQEHEPRITELTQRLTVLSKGIEAYCRVNAQQLKEEAGSKTIKLPAGEIQYRAGREKVELEDEEEVIERLEAAGLGGLVDRTPSVSKRTLKKHRDEIAAIKGIRIVRGEEQIKLKPA